MEIDTSNHQLVGSAGPDIVIMNPKTRIPKKEALVHAAWIVALACKDETEFEEVLEAVLAL